MDARQLFSETYAEAREKFMTSAQKAGAEICSHFHPLKGPAGENLTTDVARLGPPDADTVLMTFSGVHGAEGFAGSAVQIGLLRDPSIVAPDDKTAVVHVHAVTPWGFAWLRREDEGNCDILRNASGHRPPHPANPAYDELADAIVPSEWMGPIRDNADRRLELYVDAHGQDGLMRVIKAGQYSHPKGFIFHGREQSWSTATILDIAKKNVTPSVKRHVIVDLHTGLGSFGQSLLISPSGGRSNEADAIRRWIGREPFGSGDTVNIPLHHVHPYQVIKDLHPETETIVFAIEYGTLPWDYGVLTMVRAAQWLHHYGDRETKLGRSILDAYTNHFNPVDDRWREMIVAEGFSVIQKTSAGLRHDRVAGVSLAHASAK